MESTDTLTILPHFKTIQQSSEWSCGVAAAEMVINYFGLLDNHTEKTLAEFRPQKLEPGPTDLNQELQILQKAGGMNVESTLDVKEDGKPIQETFHLSNIQDYLKRGMPVLVCWNDWGGHWQIIIGYDTMGTEIENDDVIIVADPYDTTDHNQDGYGVYPAMRFIYNFTMYNFFGDKPEDNDMLFIAVAKA
jgi:hypothetical protein